MTPDIASIVNFVKENWDELLLLIFTIVQCFYCFVNLKDRDFYIFFIYAPVYFPTLLLLVASLFFNLSWRMLSGYVIGASLVTIVTLLCYGKGGEYTKKVIANGLFTVFVCFSLLLG